MRTLEKFIYYLIVAGIITLVIKEYYAQRDLEIIRTEDVFGWYHKLGGYGNILISIASLLSFVLYRKYFPFYVTLCYLAIILCVTLASSDDLAELIKKPSSWYSTKGIGTYVNMGLIFFVASKYYFDKVMKILYYLCFFFIVAGFINLSKVGIGATRTQNQYAILNFAVYLIWVFPYFFLQDEFNKRVNLVNFIAYMAIFLFVLATGSRSYLIIYFSYFIVKFKSQLQKKNSILLILGMALLMIAGFFLLSNSSFSNTLDNAFSILSERGAEDSRSNQLTEFLDQFDLNYLIQGVGPSKTWFWTATGPYPYLDNQFLLMAWWAGLPTLLFYLFLLGKAFLKKSEILLFENIKGARLILGWWILACLGFAIYITVSSNLFYYFITLLMGQQFCKYTDIFTLPELEND